MKGAEKDAAMARFAAGETQLLVATTVIEVGVDVPEATIMVIEHAERFGLAQLHQLRGRIGRGSGHSTCLLLYKAPLGETAKARLAVLRDTEDGFRIAEEDLKLRGEGDLLGTRQSGLLLMRRDPFATAAAPVLPPPRAVQKAPPGSGCELGSSSTKDTTRAFSGLTEFAGYSMSRICDSTSVSNRHGGSDGQAIFSGLA